MTHSQGWPTTARDRCSTGERRSSLPSGVASGRSRARTSLLCRKSLRAELVVSPEDLAMSIANPLADSASTDPEDRILVARARSGDRAGLEELVRRHQGWIYNIAIRM